ncbi:hypothetical protein [Actinomadura flavalba]|uniref:hypothetical protein n=1 Tax=Actinomadura flavalba TaxID=1120938 RepID=UPI0012DF1ACF|nr:hypothetical protein [Actinomadura flavalba]
MIDDQAAAELADTLAARVAQRVQAARERGEQQRADRAAKNAHRAAGLRARHARKLARIQHSRTPPMTDIRADAPPNGGRLVAEERSRPHERADAEVTP